MKLTGSPGASKPCDNKNHALSVRNASPPRSSGLVVQSHQLNNIVDLNDSLAPTVRSKKLDERVRRFPGPLLQNPMAGVFQDDNIDIGCHQLHLLGELIA